MKLSVGMLARRELQLRWVSAVATLFIIAGAVAMVLLANFLATASEVATRRIQRDIGLNLVILPPQTDLDAWWIDRVPRGTMPQDWIDRLQEQDVANRLVPMLVARVQVGNAEALLTGIDEERFKRGVKMKKAFGRTIEAGTVVLGALAGKSAGAEEGESIEIKGVPFTIARILEPTGSEEDVRAWVSLADAQRILDVGPRLNEIRALECHCSEDVADPLAALRAELEPLVPGAKIVRMDALADARRAQRLLAERLIGIAAPTAVALAAIIVVILTLVNVNDRRKEIGVLRANNFGQGAVLCLFLSRALILGIVGGALGWAIAFILGGQLASELIGRNMLSFDLMPLLGAVVITALCSVIAAIFPALTASMWPPANLMRLP